MRNCLHTPLFTLVTVSVQLTRVNNREHHGCDNKRKTTLKAGEERARADDAWLPHHRDALLDAVGSRS
jgi:hypothetical protein